MQKMCMCWVHRQFMEEPRENSRGATINFLTQYEENWNDLLEQIITSSEGWIHFYLPERKSVSVVWKKK